MDIDNISREDILKKIDSLKDDNKRVYESAITHMKNILNNFIKENNFENICKISCMDDAEYFEIEVGDKNSIDIYFRKDWFKENKSRKLKLNFCTFGSFCVNEMEKRDYLVVLGKLTEKMDRIEYQMLNFNWNEYDEIREKFHNANYELKMYDEEVKNREFNNKKNEIVKNLIVGSKICIGKKNEWKEGSGYTKVDDIRKIERIGNKTVDISSMWHRVKKDYLIDMIAKDSWKIIK